MSKKAFWVFFFFSAIRPREITCHARRPCVNNKVKSTIEPTCIFLKQRGKKLKTESATPVAHIISFHRRVCSSSNYVTSKKKINRKTYWGKFRQTKTESVLKSLLQVIYIIIAEKGIKSENHQQRQLQLVNIGTKLNVTKPYFVSLPKETPWSFVKGDSCGQ